MTNIHDEAIESMQGSMAHDHIHEAGKCVFAYGIWACPPNTHDRGPWSTNAAGEPQVFNPPEVPPQLWAFEDDRGPYCPDKVQSVDELMETRHGVRGPSYPNDQMARLLAGKVERMPRWRRMMRWVKGVGR